MKLRFLTVVMAAVVGLGILAAGAAPASAHDCDDGWRGVGYYGDACYPRHYRHRHFREVVFGGPFLYQPAYYHRHFRRYHRVVTVYRTVPVYRHYRRVRYYHRPHRVTRVYRVTTIIR